MATWADVERVGLTLPEAVLGEAHEGSPALFVHNRQFARLRLRDDGGEVLQFWVAEHGLVEAYVAENASTFRGAAGYSPYVVMADLDALANDLVRELLVDSWSCRAPAHLLASNADLR